MASPARWKESLVYLSLCLSRAFAFGLPSNCSQNRHRQAMVCVTLWVWVCVREREGERLHVDAAGWRRTDACRPHGSPHLLNGCQPLCVSQWSYTHLGLAQLIHTNIHSRPDRERLILLSLNILLAATPESVFSCNCSVMGSFIAMAKTVSCSIMFFLFTTNIDALYILFVLDFFKIRLNSKPKP